MSIVLSAIRNPHSYFFQNKNIFLRHIENNTPCDDIIAILSVTMMTQTDEARCSLCGKLFRGKSKLDMHRKVVHVYDFQTCNVCRKEFKNGKILKTHLRSIHRKEAHTCKECKKEFTSYRKMHHHIVIAHERESDRICDICGVLYESNYAMKRHMKKICSQRPSKTRTHIVSGKQDSLEGGYCEDCDKTFKTKRSFHRHKTLHVLGGKAKCNMCPFTCSDATSLRRHYRNVHSVVKEQCQFQDSTTRI